MDIKQKKEIDLSCDGLEHVSKKECERDSLKGDWQQQNITFDKDVNRELKIENADQDSVVQDYKKGIRILLREEAKTFKPDEKWKEMIQTKLGEMTTAKLSHIRVTNKLIWANADVILDKHEILCDEIYSIINESCRILIFKKIPTNQILFQSSYIFSKGYPVLECGCIIEKRSNEVAINKESLEDFFSKELNCTNVNIQSFKEGWKISFDTEIIVHKSLNEKMANSLGVKYYQLYLKRNDSSFRDYFLNKWVIYQPRKGSIDYESEVMNALKNGYGDQFGFD